MSYHTAAGITRNRQELRPRLNLGSSTTPAWPRPNISSGTRPQASAPLVSNAPIDGSANSHALDRNADNGTEYRSAPSHCAVQARN